MHIRRKFSAQGTVPKISVTTIDVGKKLKTCTGSVQERAREREREERERCQRKALIKRRLKIYNCSIAYSI